MMQPVINTSFLLSLSPGQVVYSHKKGDPGGNFAFTFDVIDADGNSLTDQVFYISVLGKDHAEVMFSVLQSSGFQRFPSHMYCKLKCKS